MGNEPDARDTLEAMIAWDRMEAWEGWKHADFVDLTVAACLLTAIAPSKYENNRVLPAKTEAMLKALKAALLTGALRPFAAWTWEYIDWERRGIAPLTSNDIGPHTDLADNTTVKVCDLAAWCDSRGIAHPWSTSETQHAAVIATYPDELRAAIEAFEAVHSDINLLRGRSPKTVLTEWLKNHKPDLSASARDRIATVANWQREGGAPKTPGK